MNKLIKQFAIFGMTGALLAAGSTSCFAEEAGGSSSSGGFFSSVVNSILSNVSEEDIEGITGALSSVVNSEEVMGVVEELLNSDEAQEVLCMAGTMWNDLPDAAKEEMAPYLALLFPDEIGVADPSDLNELFEGEEGEDNIQELTAEEAAAAGLVINPSEDMEVYSYTLIEDETLGAIYTATVLSGENYYNVSCFQTEETELSAIDFGYSLTTAMAAFEGFENTEAAVNGLDAEVIITSSGYFGSVNWIDAEDGLYYCVDAFYTGDDDSVAYTPETLTQLAETITAK